MHEDLGLAIRPSGNQRLWSERPRGQASSPSHEGDRALRPQHKAFSPGQHGSQSSPPPPQRLLRPALQMQGRLELGQPGELSGRGSSPPTASQPGGGGHRQHGGVGLAS